MQHEEFAKSIGDRLEALNVCSSPDERSSVSEAVAASAPVDAPPSEGDLESVAEALLEYCDDISETDVKRLVFGAAFDAWGEDVAHITNNGIDSDEDSQSNSSGKISPESDEDESEEDGDFIGEGECELCERAIKLTRHHLIPKTTHARIKKKLWAASPVIESLHLLATEEKKAKGSAKVHQMRERREELELKLEKILGTMDLSGLPETITNDTVRGYLGRVANLCRQCHSTVHRVKTEMELATHYNTIDRLLTCDEVVRFSKWANKQRPGKV